MYKKRSNKMGYVKKAVALVFERYEITKQQPLYSSGPNKKHLKSLYVDK